MTTPTTPQDKPAVPLTPTSTGKTPTDATVPPPTPRSFAELGPEVKSRKD